MRRPRGLLLLAIALSATPASGQEGDAQVLKPGQFRLRVGAEYLYVDSRFGPNGTEPLDGGLDGPLTPVTFAPLQPIAADVADFLVATAAEATGALVDPSDLLAGNLSAAYSWNTRIVPFQLSAGVLPRVEIGVQMPIYRNERLTRRFDIQSGNVGVNPDPVGNAALLRQINPDSETLGAAAVLPLEESPLGQELQARVFALTGETLLLPEDPLVTADLLTDSLGIRPPRFLSEWMAGDLEIGSRVEVLSNLPDGLYPDTTQAFAYRLAAYGALRFPTGQRSQQNPLLEWGPEVGFGGTRFAAAGDLFIGEYIWISAGAGMQRNSTGDVLVAIVPEGGPLAGSVELVEARRKPGNETDFWIVPRARLNKEMSFGGSLLLERWGEGTDEVGGEVVTTPRRSRRSLGFSIRYSSVQAYDERQTRIPIEVSLSFLTARAGSEGVTAARRGILEFSILPRLWGRP